MKKNMKNRLKKGVLLLGAMAALCAGCGENEAQITTIEGTLDNEVLPGEYEVFLETFEETENHVIMYPVISLWENQEQQEAWNDEFYQIAETNASYYTPEDSCDIRYEVTNQSNQILSLVETGYMDYQGAAHPSQYMSTYNINIKTGAKMTLQDMADPAELANTLLNTQDYTIAQGTEQELSDILLYNFGGEMPSQELLAASLSHFDMELSDYGPGECFGHSYLKDEKICLVFEVEHAVGDYVAIEIQ